MFRTLQIGLERARKIVSEGGRRLRASARALRWPDGLTPPGDPAAIFAMALRHARRVIVTVVGFTLLIGGVVMIVTPGPGLLVMIIGLSVLAAEFVWARRLLKRVRQTGAQIGETVFGRAKPAAAAPPDSQLDADRIARSRLNRIPPPCD